MCALLNQSTWLTKGQWPTSSEENLFTSTGPAECPPVQPSAEGIRSNITAANVLGRSGVPPSCYMPSEQICLERTWRNRSLLQYYIDGDSCTKLELLIQAYNCVWTKWSCLSTRKDKESSPEPNVGWCCSQETSRFHNVDFIYHTYFLNRKCILRLGSTIGIYISYTSYNSSKGITVLRCQFGRRQSLGNPCKYTSNSDLVIP